MWLTIKSNVQSQSEFHPITCCWHQPSAHITMYSQDRGQTSICPENFKDYYDLFHVYQPTHIHCYVNLPIFQNIICKTSFTSFQIKITTWMTALLCNKESSFINMKLSTACTPFKFDWFLLWKLKPFCNNIVVVAAATSLQNLSFKYLSLYNSNSLIVLR